MTTPANTPTPLPRETFDQAVFSRAATFARDLFLIVPELESVAIIPSWSIQQDRVPYAFVQGRNGAMQGASELLRMMYQVHGTSTYLMQQGLRMLQAFDREAADLAALIETRRGELAQLEQELAAQRPSA